MISAPPLRPPFFRSLSGRLLTMTIGFVLLAEVLVYIPSVSRYRRVYLEDQIAKAHLAALALEASPDNAVPDKLAMMLLQHAGAHAVVLKTPDRRMLMLGDSMPPKVDATFDMQDATIADWIGDAITAMLQGDNRILRVVDRSPRDENATVEVIIDEAPLRRAMYVYSWRIVSISIVISLLTAALIYFVLQWLMVRPMVRLTSSMMRFRDHPEDERTTILPSHRGDEIGMAEQELADMQRQVRAALRQQSRLAMLGSAVAKIHHDLRNTLASAVLASDRLADIDDPQVQRLAPRLYGAIDRAVALTSRTLDYAREEPPPLRPTMFPLRALLADVENAIMAPRLDAAAPARVGGSGLDIDLIGDREQLFRAFSNLALNAAQAGAHSIRFDAHAVDGHVVVDVRDDGTGIPPAIRERLFVPFAGSNRPGGSGLGLVIAREILTAHGGDLALAESSTSGTTFRIHLPATASG